MPSQLVKDKKNDSSSTAGITTDENGIRHIPSSVRADGSVRKEIRIKPGYRPPEDVEVYKNRTAEAWKNRGKGGVPGADSAADDQGNSSTAAVAKNAKRREARRKAAALSNQDSSEAPAAAKSKETAQSEKTEELLDPEAEKEKQVKKLAKKLRQARDLKDKKDAGSNLLPEQFEKVIRINELIRQLDALGFDANGEQKVS